MLKNYIVIALRHLVTQKLYSAINILGLAIGLACCILIALFVKHEMSFDLHFTNADRIHRVSRDFFPPDGSPELYLAAMAPNTAPLLKSDFPEVEKAGRIFGGRVLVARDDVAFYEPQFRMADNEIFEIFDFEWLQGDPSQALIEPFTMVLTESTAAKYFGDENAMGQTLLIENQMPAKITGIIRDLPDNTHLSFSMLGSLPTATAAFGEDFLDNWGSNNFHTYVLLAEGADIATIQSQSGEFFERHFREDSSEFTGFTTFALTDIHLKSGREGEFRPSGSMTTIYTFSVIAAFILLIACINFMNLATARSAQRAREVGMRKVMGAYKGQIVTQFLGESMLLALIGVVLAVALVELLLPAFATFVDKELVFDYIGEPAILGWLAALTVFVGLVAGSYPAFYLSAFQPARVLKGDVTRGSAAVWFRKALVVVQFSISIALLIATAIVFSQMRFARDIELGYQKDQIVVLSGSPTGGLGEQWESMKQQLLSHPNISHVTASNLTPGTQNTNGFGIRAEEGDPEGRGMPFLMVDFGFFETYGMEMAAGRAFSEEYGTDRTIKPSDENPQTTGAYIVNELAARQLGWSPDEAVGKWFEVGMARDFAQSARGQIVGVARDIYFESVRDAIKPVVYFVPPDKMFGFPALRQASIRVSARDIKATLAHIDSTWEKLIPDQPVTRRFLEEDFDAMYESERKQGKMFTYFSLLAVFIACLGLFGLASFTTERRTKEIGIRKVMGGSVWDIVKLFTTEFSKLVLVANLIAWPAAWFLMQRWLENFAYRVTMTPLVFVGSALAALLIAWLTVGVLAARAANAKPVMALRYE